jgi:hypothetical protein
MTMTQQKKDSAFALRVPFPITKRKFTAKNVKKNAYQFAPYLRCFLFSKNKKAQPRMELSYPCIYILVFLLKHHFSLSETIHKISRISKFY